MVNIDDEIFLVLKTGIDRLLETDEVNPNLNWGLLSSNASRTSSGLLTRSALVDAGFSIKRLFTPEHGLSARGTDGAPQADGTDHITGLPVYSLYGTSLSPKLDGLDGVIFDLPDIGSRFYTYIWSLSYLMEECAEKGKKLVILDRPNPISGRLGLVEGPMLEESVWSSFIGRWSIPIRHSLTVAELANFWRTSKGMQELDISFVLCQGWEREMFWSDTGLPFYPPSPAITAPTTLLTYPALAYLEGLNLSEGRGTDAPFQQFGAPWLNPSFVLELLEQYQMPGATWEQVSFTPVDGRYSGHECHGLRLRIRDPLQFRPVYTGIVLLAVLYLTHSAEVQQATYPTWVNPIGKNHLGLMFGSSALLQALENRPADLFQQAQAYTAAPAWNETVALFLLY